MPALPPFIPVKSQDQTLTLIQGNLSKALAPALANPLLGGVYVTVTFPKANTDQLVTHGLGSASKVAWLVGPVSTPASVLLSSNNGNSGLNPKPANQILLQSTVAGLTVGLYFFNAP